MQVTTLMQIAGIYKILQLFGTAADIDVHTTLRRPFFENFTIPVVVRIHIMPSGRFQCIIRIIRIQPHQRIQRTGNHLSGIFFVHTVVPVRFVTQSHKFPRINPFRLARERLETLVERDIQLSLSYFATLGRDQDHTVRTTHTVYGGSRGVLQHRNRSDLVCIQRTDIVTRHTVNQDQRSRTVRSGSPTQIQVGIVETRLRTAGLQRGQTGQTSGQRVGQVRRRTLTKFLAVNRRYGGNHGNFLLSPVTDHDLLFELLRIAFHLHVDRGTSANFHFHCLIAQIAECQLGSRGNFDRKLTVHVGHHAVRRTRSNRHTDQGSAILILNGT